jgi:hypothetical protein
MFPSEGIIDFDRTPSASWHDMFAQQAMEWLSSEAGERNNSATDYFGLAARHSTLWIFRSFVVTRSVLLS